MEKFVKTYFNEYKELIKSITSIPAPSHHEEKRALFIQKYLIDLGYNPVIDQVKNVYVKIDGEVKDTVLFSAHTDTVFPDLTPIEVTEDEIYLKAPGIGDDTTCVAGILMILKYLKSSNIKPYYTTVFALNSCEEGFGNLLGSKQLVETFEDVLKLYITFDAEFYHCVSDAVGSKRYNIVVKTEGGHSFNAFGNRNAIEAASKLINDFYNVDASLLPDKTTYNVGVIEGGTSINSIAQEVSFKYEYRSDQLNGLKQMDEIFNRIINNHQKQKDVEIEVELLGERPTKGDVDMKVMHSLEDTVRSIVEKHAHITPIFESGSTDCNVPLSKGIPAICVPGYNGGKSHTREEYVIKESLVPGLKIMMETVLTYIKKRA